MTNETKHTPGPWWVVPIAPTCVASDYGSVANCRLYRVDQGDALREQQANALLIAAAPETAAERDRLREANAELAEALRPFADLDLTAWGVTKHSDDRLVYQSRRTTIAIDDVIKARAALDKHKGET